MTLPPRTRVVTIERAIGLQPRFERTDGGWLFRYGGHGPAIRLSDAEHRVHAARALPALLLHAAALLLFGWLAWLLLERLLPGWSGNARALALGLLLPLIGLALYASLRHQADAPSRDFTGRPPERPARDPDLTRQPGYGTILAFTLGLLFLAAVGTQQPRAFYIAFAGGAVTLGLILLARRWWFGRTITPAQRRQMRDTARDERVQARRGASVATAWAQGALLLVFIAVELAMLAGGVAVGVLAVMQVTGRSWEALTFGLFMLGFLPGLALGGLLFWPLERLCKRWTGSSAVHAFDWLPAGW